MKTTAILLITLGLASPPMWVQAQTSSTLPQDMESQSRTGARMQSEASEATPSAPASGTSGASGASGESGESGIGNDNSAGGADAMQTEGGTEMREEQVTAALPDPQTQGDVTYLCGGIGNREQTFMKQQAKDYDLMLTFATRTGAYLADVNVDIRDTKGTSVLQAECDGPLMLVNLPRSGTYQVRADASGHTLNRTVRVTDSRTRGGQRIASAVLTWPQQVAEAPLETSPASGATGDGESEGNSKGSSAR